MARGNAPAHSSLAAPKAFPGPLRSAGLDHPSLGLTNVQPQGSLWNLSTSRSLSILFMSTAQLSLFFTTFKAKTRLFHQEVITAFSPLWQPQGGLEFVHNPQTVLHLLLEDLLSYSLSKIKTFVYLLHFLSLIH